VHVVLIVLVMSRCLKLPAFIRSFILASCNVNFLLSFVFVLFCCSDSVKMDLRAVCFQSSLFVVATGVFTCQSVQYGSESIRLRFGTALTAEILDAINFVLALGPVSDCSHAIGLNRK